MERLETGETEKEQVMGHGRRSYRWWVGIFVVLGGLLVGQTPSSTAQRASLSGIDAKLDEVLRQLDELPCKLVVRFVDNRDGTITDCRTGLMWEKKCQNTVDPSCPADHDVDSTFTWFVAIGAWLRRINAENGSGFAGHNDWRVPTIDELPTILRAPFPCPAPAPCIDPVFNNRVDSFTAGLYWSSSAIEFPFDFDAWVVNFNDGYVLFDTKNLPLPVRAVRGGR
jgi:hypothetical protein